EVEVLPFGRQRLVHRAETAQRAVGALVEQPQILVRRHFAQGEGGALEHIVPAGGGRRCLRGQQDQQDQQQAHQSSPSPSPSAARSRCTVGSANSRRVSSRRSKVSSGRKRRSGAYFSVSS